MLTFYSSVFIFSNCTFNVNKFPNKLVRKVANNNPRNLSFCSFASVLTVLIASFVNKPDSSSGLTIFILSLVSSLEIIYVVCFAKSEGCEINSCCCYH